MSDDYLKSLISKTASMINRWHGRPAAMFELTASHKSLSVIVYGEKHGSNLLVVCHGPEFICGPTTWSNSRIIIVPAKLDAGGQGIALIDEGAGVRVTAESFEVKENVLYLWSPRR